MISNSTTPHQYINDTREKFRNTQYINFQILETLGKIFETLLNPSAKNAESITLVWKGTTRYQRGIINDNLLSESNQEIGLRVGASNKLREDH